MADFAIAFDETMINEGGYVDDPDDRGGETYRGVARRFHP
ncbi:MAG: glycosyl hydrolase 108 family protein, partial [Planctomycetota bacterium]